MFKKLKDKIAEESQTKLQQLAQAAGYNIPASDVNTDSFFSITDETPQNSPHHKPATLITSTAVYNNGAAPHPAVVRTRRLSNSSQASDVSFKLPVYDSELPAVYHLQSDLESASELDEAGSVAAMGGQLDLVSKEQLHGAYKKALDRYQKYRGMYTDLARKYRELERDNTKARAVLVETQDKALRRISELREQCSLEQQAKAHLEAALRLEMDEMQCVVKTLTTKLELMGVNAEMELNNDKNSENLIQLNNDTASHASSEFSSPLTSQSTELDKKILDLETQIKQLKEQGMEKDARIIVMTDETRKLKEELTEVTSSYDTLRSKDENNSFLLAENKMVIHSELEAKENEMDQLRTQLEKVENDIKTHTKENQTLTDQIGTLKKQLLESKTVNQASKEMHSTQISELDTALKSSRDEKHQLELKFVDVEKEVNDLKTEKTTLVESLAKVKEERTKLEEQFVTFKNQFGLLQQELKDSLANNDLLCAKVTEIFEDSFQEKFDGNPESLKKVHAHLREMRDKIDTLSAENKTMLDDKTKIEQRLTVLFEEKQKVNASLKEAQEKLEKKDKEIENLRVQSSTLVSNEDKIKNLQETYEEKVSTLESDLREKCNVLQECEQKLGEALQDRTTLENEVTALKSRIQELEVGYRTSEEKYVTELEPINNELARLRQELVDKAIEIEKCNELMKQLMKEKEMEKKQNQKYQEETTSKDQKIQQAETELGLMTQKQDELSSELTKVLEQVAALESKVQELTLKNETLTKELDDQRNEKQDHSSEVTTLKGKIELLRKEKSDLEKTLEREIREKSELKTQVVNILKEITRLEEQLNEVKTSHSKIQSEKEQLEQKFETFNEKSLKENESNKKLQTEYLELQRQLQESFTEKENLQTRIQQLEANVESEASLEAKTALLAEKEEQLVNVRTQLTQCLAENAKLLDEKELLEHQVRSLQDDIEVKEKEKLTVLDTNQCLVDSLNEQKGQVTKLKDNVSALEEQKSALTETCDSLMEKVDALKKENISLRAEREQFQQRLEDIQGQLEEANNKHSIRENKIRMLADENKNFKSDLEGTGTRIEEILAQVRQLETENTELRTNLNTLETELKSFKEQPTPVKEEHFEQLKQEINELKTVNTRLSTEASNQVSSEELDQIKQDRDSLKAKLEEIMKEIAGINSNANDLATRNLFLEQKCENYLILEQSNERLKNQVEKLSRQLDETLVSLHHNEGLAANTEFEYLRNILFQYLSGSAGVNGKTLVKVIAAVLKFTPQQTQVVVEKEALRHSLVGQINNLL